MSFILDALKKSESERQRQGAPGIASIAQETRQKSSGKWIWVVVILLTINLLAISALLVWKESASVVQQTLSEAPTESTPAATATIIEPPQPQIEANDAQPAPDLDSPVAGPLPLAETAPDETTASSVAEGLETFNDLRAKGQLQLPEMHLDIHVYSGTPADRFVFVNMSKYKENTTLSEGPRVYAITPEGVVLEHLGLRFLLPRE